MLTPTSRRLAGFAAAVAMTSAGAVAAGAVSDATPPLQDCLDVAAERALAAAGDGGEMAGDADMVEALPGADGRSSRLAGLRLTSRDRALGAGAATTWRFRIEGCDGRAVRDMEPEQGRLLHLIVVRDDLGTYEHLHPRLLRDGTWVARVTAPGAGRFRAYADFVRDGRKHVLGTTLTAPGRAGRAPLPQPAQSASTGGYDVELERPAVLRAGEEAQLTFRITRAGRPVRGLQPYLGAYGHLVAVHAPDLAYSHVHPDGEDRASGAITFATEFERPGAHRLFLQFKTGGSVRTAAFTQEVSR